MNFFPISPHGLTPVSFNWNIVIVTTSLLPDSTCALLTVLQFAGVVAIAGIYYAIRGRKVYVGPVAYVRKDI